MNRKEGVTLSSLSVRHAHSFRRALRSSSSVAAARDPFGFLQHEFLVSRSGPCMTDLSWKCSSQPIVVNNFAFQYCSNFVVFSTQLSLLLLLLLLLVAIVSEGSRLTTASSQCHEGVEYRVDSVFFAGFCFGFVGSVPFGRRFLGRSF